ncbi:MAG: iron-containing redox enzyme family protein [Alphaproteobacteria bacterium]|nr:iron-containing redox enzyme family protein [Alphaproteobacteria bacterium]
MTFYEELVEATAKERSQFQNIPLIRHAMARGASKELYLDFLTEAYHHVKHTVPLLNLAVACCSNADASYKKSLVIYIDEETGHDEWILDDIKALGGNAEAVRHGQGRLPCRLMISHAYFGIERVSPYCLLGMVHVLEGMSVALAHHARDAIIKGFEKEGVPEAFSYLTSHGALDVQHVSYFEKLVNSLTSPEQKAHVLEAARDFYKLYGDIFRDLGDRHGIKETS